MATKKKETKKKLKNISVDFSGVKSFKKVGPGQYKAEVTDVTHETNKNDNSYLNFEFTISEGKSKGSKVWAKCYLTEGALFRLRDCLTALGIEVPDDEMDVNPADLLGLTCGIEVTPQLDQEKEETGYMEVSNFIGEDDVEEDDQEDKKDTKKASKKGKKAADEDDEDTDVADVSSMDEDELEEFVKERGLDVELEDFGSIKKKRAAVEAALESDSSDDEDEKSAKGKKSKKDEDDEDAEEKFSEETIEEMDLADLESLNEDHKLKIKDFEDLSKKEARKAVLKALKKAGLLED